MLNPKASVLKSSKEETVPLPMTCVGLMLGETQVHEPTVLYARLINWE